MGCEGAATRNYFGALAEVLPSVWQFSTRQRRPPPDPVNAMLSFDYTILLNEAVAACIRLVRTQQCRPQNFTHTAEQGCRLNDTGRRAFLDARTNGGC